MWSSEGGLCGEIARIDVQRTEGRHGAGRVRRQHRREEALTREPDDELRLPTRVVGRRHQEPDLSDVDLRLRIRGRGEAILRARRGFGRRRTGGEAGPHLQPPQQSRPRDPRESPHPVGRSRTRPRLRVRDGRDHDHDPCVRSTRGCAAPHRPSLRRDRPFRARRPARIRCPIGRVGTDDGRRRRRRRTRRGDERQTPRSSADGDARQSDQRPLQHCHGPPDRGSARRARPTRPGGG